MSNKKRFHLNSIMLPILFIFVIALLLRVYKLDSIPFGPHQDEIMNGYVGRFILLNGKDLYGNSWPLLYFDRFGDFPNVIPMYISGLSTFIFGVNEFAIRFPVALTGSLVIFPIYLISYQLFKSKRTGLISAFLAAITPWHIVLSRATSEGILATTAYLFAIFLLLSTINKYNSKKLLLSTLLFLSTYFLYPAFRILVPLSLLPFIYIAKDSLYNVRKKIILISIGFFIVTFSISQTHWGQGRFDQTSIFNPNSGVSNRLEQLIFNEGPNQVIKARLFHNKLTGFSREFLDQYFSYFSANFLFIRGGRPLRYFVPEQGLFYLTYFIAIILIFFSRKNSIPSEKKLMLLIGFLILMAPIPAALTTDDTPNIHRSVLLSTLLIFPLTLGFTKAATIKLKQISLIQVLVAITILEFIFFWHQYSVHSSTYQSFYRGDAKRELIFKLDQQQSNYTSIFMPAKESLPLYYLFYTHNFDPSLAGKFSKDITLNRVDNIIFLHTVCPSETFQETSPPQDSIIIDKSDCADSNSFIKLDEIFRIDGTSAYKFLLPANNNLNNNLKPSVSP